MEITTVGLDLAKNTFHLIGANRGGTSMLKKQLKRARVKEYFAQLSPTLVAMEACASAHYWARELQKFGHRVKLLPPHKVKPYLGGQKNDYNDAAAIAEAATRDNIRAVPIKTVEQQDYQALHRIRQACCTERTALSNQLRSVIAEFGIVIPTGVAQLRRHLPELLEDADNGLSLQIRPWLAKAHERLLMLDEQLDYFTQELNKLSRQDERCQRLQSIPGFGPIVSSVFVAHVGDGSAFKRGRDVSASIGVVPRQYTTGGKPVLLGITKRGNGYLRSLLIHGARSVVRHAEGKDDALSQWVNRVKAKRGANKAAVALANKLARIGWAILANNSHYQPA